MVFASLVWLRLACGNNPDFVASQDVGYDQEPILHHAEKDQAVLAVIFAVVYEVDREWIIEGSRACSKVTPCLA